MTIKSHSNVQILTFRSLLGRTVRHMLYPKSFVFFLLKFFKSMREVGSISQFILSAVPHRAKNLRVPKVSKGLLGLLIFEILFGRSRGFFNDRLIEAFFVNFFDEFMSAGDLLKLTLGHEGTFK